MLSICVPIIYQLNLNLFSLINAYCMLFSLFDPWIDEPFMGEFV